MENNTILIRNEREANKLAAKISLIMIVFIAFVYVLDVLGIFVVPLLSMSIAMGAATMFLLVPSFLVFILKSNRPCIKYFIVISCTLMVSVLSLLLAWHVVIMFIFPIAIASLYFSRKLSWYAVILSLVCYAASQVGSFYSGGVTDHNLPGMFEVVLYGIAPRSIEVLALSSIFITLSGRTKKLLQSMVGAEDQKNTLDQMMALTDKSYEVTNTLTDSVKELSGVTGNAIKSNEQIAKMTGKIVNDSQQTIEYVGEASSVVSTVASNLKIIAKDNKQISIVTQEAKVLTDNNTANMKDAANGIYQIDEATKKSRDIILRLGEKSNEIANIAQVIKNIATSTNLLSLNASIESARAGEQGKGFAVVASEIRGLAEQSQQAVGNIEQLIQKVLEDTSEAVNSMDVNMNIVQNGLAMIHKADKSSEEVTKSIEKINSMAKNITTISTSVADNGEKITKAVDNISNLTTDNMDMLKTILTASEEQLRAMNEVAVFVQSIDSTSIELLSVVNKTDRS